MKINVFELFSLLTYTAFFVYLATKVGEVSTTSVFTGEDCAKIIIMFSLTWLLGYLSGALHG